jgi:SAM-dependent methyltransferase
MAGGDVTKPNKMRSYGASLLAHWTRRVHPNASGRPTGLWAGESTIPHPDRSLLVGPTEHFDDVALTTMGRMNMAGLHPDHDVLDVGCGVGRIARYLCGYLHEAASYEGFDVREEVVSWCRENITPRFPHFHFQAVPLFNTSYAADSSLPSAATFVFPYPEGSFDFVLAHSVYTHLQPEAARNYLNETSRVLRPGGTSYTTWVLINDDGTAFSHPGTDRMHRDPSGEFSVRRPDDPDDLIAYTESFIRRAHAESGLTIIEPIHPGFILQDAIVARK